TSERHRFASRRASFGSAFRGKCARRCWLRNKRGAGKLRLEPRHHYLIDVNAIDANSASFQSFLDEANFSVQTCCRRVSREHSKLYAIEAKTVRSLQRLANEALTKVLSPVSREQAHDEIAAMCGDGVFKGYDVAPADDHSFIEGNQAWVPPDDALLDARAHALERRRLEKEQNPSLPGDGVEHRTEALYILLAHLTDFDSHNTTHLTTQRIVRWLLAGRKGCMTVVASGASWTLPPWRQLRPIL